MMKPKVSVIVPAYNTECYIAECLDSLQNQSLPDVEIVVVDDGSSDGTGDLVASRVTSDDSIVLVRQENGGLSTARNAGLAHARGAYVGFVDADDYVHRDMYQMLLDKAERDQCDIVVGNGVLFDDTTRGTKPFQDKPLWARLKERSPDLLFTPSQHPDLFLLDTSACRRLYRRDFLARLNFAFIPGLLFEDVPAHFRLFLKASRVGLVDMDLYFYRIGRPGRITDRSDEGLLRAIDVMNYVIDDLQAFGAGTQIWANFVSFQNWVLLWLCRQISQSLRDDFAQGAIEIARRIPLSALQLFQEKFSGDRRARVAVLLQASQSREAYIEHALGRLPAVEAEKLLAEWQGLLLRSERPLHVRGGPS